MTVKCPKCQAEILDDSLLCSKCGTPIHDSDEASAPITETLQTAAHELILGKVLDGKYKITDELGRGGMVHLGILFRDALQGKKERMPQLMTPEFETYCRRDPFWSLQLTEVFASLSEKERALDWLDNAVSRGFLNYPFINEYDPFLEKIRGEERFKKLMERVKYEWEHFEE